MKYYFTGMSFVRGKSRVYVYGVFEVGVGGKGYYGETLPRFERIGSVFDRIIFK